MELPKDLSLNELWKALNLASEPAPNHDWIARMSLFGAGVLVGAGIALLVATAADEGPEDYDTDGETDPPPEPA